LSIFEAMEHFLLMQFLTPVHLWGLLLVVIPILIHLFSFRKFKNVLISDVSLLKNIKNSGIAKKNLKDLLVLLARVLVIVFLVLAFSDPVKEDVTGVKKSNYLVRIHVDNSYSMSLSGDQGELLDEAKSIAELIIHQYGVNDRFQIQDNDFSFSHGRIWQKEEAKNKVAEIKLTAKTKSFESVLARFDEGQRDHEEHQLVQYLISDFNYKIDTVSLKKSDRSLNCVAVRTTQINNIYIDSIWFSYPERKIQGYDSLCFRIVNEGEEDLLNFPVNMEMNGNTQLVALDLPARSNTQGTFVYKVPNQRGVKGVVSIEDAVLPFDNKLFYSYGIPEKIKILVVSNSADFSQVIRNLFSTDKDVSFDIISDKDINYEMVKDYDVFVLGELHEISLSVKAWLEKVHKTRGKQIVVVPSSEIDVKSYNSFGLLVDEFELSEIDSVSIELLPVDQKSIFFKHVFRVHEIQSNVKVKMPLLNKHYKILKSIGDPVILKSNHDVYLTKSKGVTLFSSGITEKSSDFSMHPLVVPVLVKIVFSTVISEELYAVYGDQKSFNTRSGWSNSYEIKSPDSVVFNGRVLDQTSGLMHLDDNFQKAGIYQVLINDSAYDYMAVNQSRSESTNELSMFKDLKRVAAQSQGITVLEDVSKSNSKIKEQIKGKTYWKLFLILAGICLVMEMIIIRFGRLKS
jgi:hypothetical protein